MKKNDLQCNKLIKTIDWWNKQFIKNMNIQNLNNKIKRKFKINKWLHISLKIMMNYNYIILCDLTYDENILKNINFNKNVNSLVDKIQKQFCKKI